MEGPPKGPTNTGIQKEKTTETISREEIIYKLTKIKEDVSGYHQTLPLLLDYLNYSCKAFKAGQVAKHVAAWSGITQDKEILDYVRGVEIDLTEVPNQTTVPVSKFQPHELHLVDEAISMLVGNEVISKVPPAKGRWVLQTYT